MADLSDFLLARIAEDEAVANGVGDYPTWPLSGARLLTECEAKRRIVELHEIATVDYAGEWWTNPEGDYVRTGCSNCTGCGSDGEEYIQDGPCGTLRLLALPYADHPGYDPEWKP